MVYFEKTQPAPACLAIEKAKNNGDYKCGDVHDRLIRDFKNKCYLCELRAITSINIEHFEAHQGDIHKKFDWNNLFLACFHCNNTKLALYNNILNCTVLSNNVETALKYTAGYPTDDVVITPQNEDIKTLETAKLLLAIFNGTTTHKTKEAENLKSLLQEEILLFLNKIQEYFKCFNDDSLKNQCIFEIEKHLSRSSSFTAFKRWIVRDRPKLMTEFGHLLD
jgi:hypothetical protein